MAEKFDNPNYNPEAGMKYLATHFEMFKPEVAKAMIADAKRKGVKIPPVVEAKARKAGIINSVRSTNAVVAKALAMNGWDSKMGWEFESKIESAIKSEVGTVTDVGAAFRDGELSTGGNRNGAITVGLYDDKARENVGRIKQIVEKVLKQYGGGRITSQKAMKLAGEDAVQFTVARNARATNAALGKAVCNASYSLDDLEKVNGYARMGIELIDKLKRDIHAAYRTNGHKDAPKMVMDWLHELGGVFRSARKSGMALYTHLYNLP